MRDPVPGVYASLDDLVRLQWKARGFTFRPRQPVHSLLAGRHGSRMRGRGLDFEELRDYLPGDDVRAIDWRVTARTGSPHVRVYTEERDRPLVLVVDQRQSMFFGTRRAMKSVAALEVAALAAWRALQQGDRVGGWVFDDDRAETVWPHRSRRAVLADIRRRAPHDDVLLVISDFDGADEETRQSLMLLSERNTVVAVPVLDPTATKLPARGRLVATGGDLQVEIDLGAEKTRERIEAYGGGRLDTLMAWQREIGMAVLPISPADDSAAQLRRLIGARTRRRV